MGQDRFFGPLDKPETSHGMAPLQGPSHGQHYPQDVLRLRNDWARPGSSLSILRLQRLAGNQAVTTLLQQVQRQDDEPGDGDATPLSDSKCPIYAGDQLTGKAVVQLAIDAGFPDAELVTAVAVAKAESGWLTRAESCSSDVGIWQINKIHWKKFGGKESLFDPVVNANAAFSVWKAGGWKMWSTYKSGAYKKFLQEAKEAVKDATASSPLPQDPIDYTEHGRPPR